MLRPFGGLSGRHRQILGWVLITACTEASPRLGVAGTRLVDRVARGSECGGSTLRPSSIPPGEGEWIYETIPESARVRAVIGPAEMRPGSTRITRSVETIESGFAVVSERHRLDTALVQLDLLPLYRDDRRVEGAAAADTAEAPQVAAVYALGPTVLLAAYEACSGLETPAVRYVRRDERGRIITDAMLRRQTTATTTTR